MSLGQKGRLRMYASITRLELKDEDSIGAAVDALDGLLADARGVAGSRDCYVVRTGPRELTMVTIYDSEARRVRKFGRADLQGNPGRRKSGRRPAAVVSGGR
jgi:hypothetical protein